MTIRDNLAANLRRFLFERRMTQSALAKAVGVSPSSVGNWLRKSDFPTADTFDRLAAIFDIEPEVLLRSPEASEVTDEQKLEQLMRSLSELVEKMGYKLVKKP